MIIATLGLGCTRIYRAARRCMEEVCRILIFIPSIPKYRFISCTFTAPSAFDMLRYPKVHATDLTCVIPELGRVDPSILTRLEIDGASS